MKRDPVPPIRPNGSPLLAAVEHDVPLAVEPSQLAHAAIADLLSTPDEDFRAAAEMCSGRTRSCIGAWHDAIPERGTIDGVVPAAH